MPTHLRTLLISLLLIINLTITPTLASSGTWPSQVTGSDITYTVTESKAPKKDYNGRYITVVYLEKLPFRKIGGNTNAEDVAWLLRQGYRVIELDYAHHPNAISPQINQDIIAINDSIAAGTFLGYSNCSRYQSYVLFEGYRIARNIPYFRDDPTVYNTPAQYQNGDSLYMDIIYPANPSEKVPTVISFSYSNSYATYNADKNKLTDAHQHQRLKLSYTLAGFNDSFLEGAPAQGIAWAIADHPKYCPWGGGQPPHGRNDTYKSYETNPDAARKVKSAIRTLRTTGDTLHLNGNIGIYGFSRGATAGAMAIGDRHVHALENAGFHTDTSSAVQAAILGPGVFDYTIIYQTTGDGDGTLETRCPWAWGKLPKNRQKWQFMGASYLIQSTAAPTLFFYNTSDEPYYQQQVAHLRARLDALHVPTSTLIDYGTGHAVPQTTDDLAQLYKFFQKHLKPPKMR